jgi:hypothetical protein
MGQKGCENGLKGVLKGSKEMSLDRDGRHSEEVRKREHVHVSVPCIESRNVA